MLYKKILVPFDHSEHAHHALELAGKMVADDPEAQIVVFRSIAGAQNIGVVLGDSLGAGGYENNDTLNRYKSLRDSQQAQALEDLKKDAEPIAKDILNPVEYVVEFYPNAVQGTLATIDEVGADAVVMGCRGMNAVAGMLGSVSYGVVRSASVPVTVVK